MKKVLLILLFIPVMLFSQDIPKKATQIFVHNTNDANENFKYASKVLTENDYAIASRDADLGTISLEPFEYRNLFLKLTIFTKDSVVRVSGQTKFGHTVEVLGVRSEDNWFKIEFRGQKGSVARKSFDGMEEVAKLLGASLTYK